MALIEDQTLEPIASADLLLDDGTIHTAAAILARALGLTADAVRRHLVALDPLTSDGILAAIDLAQIAPAYQLTADTLEAAVDDYGAGGQWVRICDYALLIVLYPAL